MTKLDESDELLAFRQEVRQFIANNLPRVVREKVRRGVLLTRKELELWESRLIDKGWYVPHWPQRWGGLAMAPFWRLTLDEDPQSGSTVKLSCTFDNTKDNPKNPSDPLKVVGWGEGTEDEMCLAFLGVTLDREKLSLFNVSNRQPLK